MEKVIVNPQDSNVSHGLTLFLHGDTAATTVWFADWGFPVSIPEDQLYYWTALWQAGEQESTEDLRRGNSRIFSNPMDAIRWLLGADD